MPKIENQINPSFEASINVKVKLDKQRTPVSMCWEADESDSKDLQPCKAVMISIWDPTKKNTVRFDLWTKEMMHHEMSTLIFQSLLMMGETYANATGNQELANEIQEFAEDFGVKAKVIKPKEDEDGVKPFHLDI